MLRKLLLVLLILPFCALLMPATASADSKYTTTTLGKVLITKADLADLVPSAVSSVTDLDPATDPVTVGRSFVLKDGSTIDIMLFSPSDGADIKGKDKSEILTEQTGEEFAGILFTKLNVDEDIGEVTTDDYALTYTGTRNGKKFNVIQVIFVKANVFGVVIYATTGENDATVAGGIYGYQSGKLP